MWTICWQFSISSRWYILNRKSTASSSILTIQNHCLYNWMKAPPFFFFFFFLEFRHCSCFNLIALKNLTHCRAPVFL
jgi:hypothetical protein